MRRTLWLASFVLLASNISFASAEDAFPVQTVMSSAQSTAIGVVAFGELAATRTATVATQTAGSVAKIHVSEGDAVDQGQLLITLDNNDRAARLRQATVALETAQSDYQRAKTLVQRQLQPVSVLDKARSLLRGAEAARDSAQIEQDRALIRAPFDGKIEDLKIELGSAVRANQELLSLVDDGGFKAVINVPQQAVFDLDEGKTVEVLVAGIRAYQGELSFIAPRAEASTRTFKVEVTLFGDLNGLRAGMTAEVDVPLKNTSAHFISPASLFLDSSGRLGVKTVEDSRVRFYPVEIVRSENNGMFVSGLPDQVEVIKVGGGFVNEGALVDAVKVDG